MTHRADISAEPAPDLGADLGADLAAATDRLVRTVDALCTDPEALAAPSLLPGWSRAHVVAHLALNAEGLARLVEGVLAGRAAPMYDSDAKRDRDIEDLAAGTGLRERLFAGSTRLVEALEHLTGEQWQASAERTPGGPAIDVARIPAMRLTEVEVHHADLDHGYGPRDWPRGFTVVVLDRFHARAASASTPFVAAPDDIVRTWEYGEGRDDVPQVSGPAWAIAWWLTGRGAGEELVSSTGELPRIGAW